MGLTSFKILGVAFVLAALGYSSGIVTQLTSICDEQSTESSDSHEFGVERRVSSVGSRCRHVIGKIPVVGWLGRKVGESWRQFRKEREEQGLVRYIRAPTDHPERFALWRVLLNPPELYMELANQIKQFVGNSWPFGVVFGSSRPFPYRVSNFTAIPMSIGFWMVVMWRLDGVADARSLEAMIKNAELGRLGANFVGQYVVTNAITPREAVSILLDHEKSLLDSNKNNIRDRVKQLERLGVVGTGAIPHSELMQLIAETISVSAQDGVFLDKEFTDYFSKKVEATTWGKKLTDVQKAYLDYLFWPTIMTEGKAEIEWLSYIFEIERLKNQPEWLQKGMGSIQRVIQIHGNEIPLPTIVNLIAATVTNPDDVATKMAKAKAIGLDSKLPETSARVDFPAFSGELNFKDVRGSVLMKDELDRWSLIFNDNRFYGIRAKFEKGEISEPEALGEVTMQVLALNPIYAAALAPSNIYAPARSNPNADLDVTQSCTLLHGLNPETSSPIFHKISESVRTEVDLTKTSASDVALLEFALANIWYDYYTGLNAQTTQAQNSALFDKSFERETKAHEALSAGKLVNYVSENWQVRSAPCVK